MVNRVVKSGFCIILGSIVFLAGLFMLLAWPAYFMSQYKKMMILKPTSISYNLWEDPKTPTYLDVYLFNITNTEEILQATNVTRPKLNVTVMECGPYVYKEELTKENITWHDDDSTIEFFNHRKYTFQPKMSKGKLEDSVTSINPVLAAFIFKHRFHTPQYYVGYDKYQQDVLDREAVRQDVMRWNRQHRDDFGWYERPVPDKLQKKTDKYEDLMNEIKKYHDTIFTTASVSDWLFNGIQFPIAGKIPSWQSGKYSDNFTKDSLEMPFDVFGWFYERNGSPEAEGPYVMNTGASDFESVGWIQKWRDSKRTYYRDVCGRVRGYDLWPPLLDEPSTIQVFSSDICTYMSLSKEYEVKIAGLEGWRYGSTGSMFDNGHGLLSRGKCFCNPNDYRVTDGCMERGVQNITECNFGNRTDRGIPMFASYPHFRWGDRYKKDIYLVAGNPPKKKKWRRDVQSVITLEWFTSATLASRMTMQYNILVTNMRGMELNNKSLPRNNTLVPMIWWSRHTKINKEHVDMINLVHKLRYGLPYAFLAIMLAGLFFIGLGLLFLSKGVIKCINKLLNRDTGRKCCQLCRLIHQRMRR